MELKFNKLEQSLFILFRCVANIEATKKLVEYIRKKNDFEEGRKDNFEFIAINNLYLYTYHFIQEENNLRKLYSENKKVKEYVDFYNENKVILKKLRIAKDLIIGYRNKLIGHYYRDDKGNFIHFSDLPENTPKTGVEIFYYSDLLNTLFVVIAKLFESELDEVLKKSNEYEKEIPPLEIDIEALDKELDTFKDIVRERYGDINKKYSN